MIENLEGEIWLPIKDFEGLYEVSNMGRVCSLLKRKGNKPPFFYIKERTIRKSNDKNEYGHQRICLFKDSRRYYVDVHRLVAQAFVPKKEGCNVVNHLDENPRNNKADNLEWTTIKGNNNYSHIPEKSRLAHIKAVVIYTKDGKRQKECESLRAAADYLGCSVSNIKNCCKHFSKSCRGYIVKYKNEE